MREQAGFVSPIRPIEPGDRWCVFEQRGTWEFIVHPADADEYLENGIVIYGTRYPVTVVDEVPYMNGRQIMAKDHNANLVFTP